MPKIVEVKQRGMLSAAVAITMTAAGAMGFGLWDLGQRRAAAPAVVAVDKASLADALDDAPWISSGGDRNAPILWLVTAPHCPACRVFEQRTLPTLLDKGVEVRVILVAPRESALPGGEAEAIAGMARRRDWLALHTWMAGGVDRSAIALEEAAAEGYLEWGRASYDRISRAVERNGLKMATPAVFWRMGLEWRAGVRPDGRAVAHLRRDLIQE